jgi:hypothetical protein
VRRVIQEAPVQIGTLRALDRLLRGLSEIDVARAEMAIAREAYQRDLRLDWPPGHPELNA